MKFRNSLRDDAWLAARYAEVKRRLAARYSFDRDAYTNGKTGFIEAVLAMPPATAQRPNGGRCTVYLSAAGADAL